MSDRIQKIEDRLEAAKVKTGPNYPSWVKDIAYLLAEVKRLRNSDEAGNALSRDAIEEIIRLRAELAKAHGSMEPVLCRKCGEFPSIHGEETYNDNNRWEIYCCGKSANGPTLAEAVAAWNKQ